MTASRPLRPRAAVLPALLVLFTTLAGGCAPGAGQGGGGGGGGSPSTPADPVTTAGATGGGGGAGPSAVVPAGARFVLVAGADQAMVRGSSLAPFVVQVTDAQGAPLAGVEVAWAVAEGNGSISPAVSRTRPDGTTWALATAGLAAAKNRYTATAVGLEGSPLLIAATGTVGPPARIVAVRGGGQTAVAGSSLAAPLVVQVRDANGVPVPSVQVAWAITAGGGALLSQRATTDADGLASAVVRLGRGAGPNAFSAAGLGFPAGVVSFAATGVPGDPARMARLSAAGGTFPAGSSQSLSVRVTDRNGNPVQGATVRWARTAGSGAVAQGTSLTGAGGVASGTVTLGGEPGPNGFSASLPHARRAVVTFSATGT